MTAQRLEREAPTGSYRELKRIVTEAGLLDRQPRYYAFKITLVVLMAAAGIALVVVIGRSWWQLLAAVYLAVAAMQTALIAHDAGHRQIFRSTFRNDLVPLLITSPFLGFNFSWWMDEHNQHHAMPNHEDLDPNINVSFWAFTEKQRRARLGFHRFMAKYQAIFVIPLNMIGGFYKIVEGARFVKNRELRYPKVEPLVLAIYVGWSVSLPFVFLAPLQAVAFIVVYYAVLGLYLGAIISPNHKGMLMVGDGHQLDFLRWQVLTARNVRGHPVTDFFFGGLNYQIEHHLFPTMPRNRLPKAVAIVRPYCEQHGIAYHETGVVDGFWEILRAMHRASAPLRGDETGSGEGESREAIPMAPGS